MHLIRFRWVFVLLLLISSSAHASIGSSRDYKKVQEFLASLANQYPQNAEVVEIGQNAQGDTIIGLKIGQGGVKHLIVGTHHGNEYGSTEIAIAIAEDLAKKPIDGRTVFVIPVLNVSGFISRSREERIGSGGSTADPNRDYPGPCGTDGPFRLKSTRALADFVDREGIVASVTLHTFGPMVLYPWGVSTSDSKTPYEKEFIDFGHLCTIGSGYQVGNSTELLYPADGTFEDYAFWKHGIWSMLFEIGTSHSPSESALKLLVQKNLPGLRAFMNDAPTTRASNHDFTGRCDAALRALDLRDE